LILFSVSNRRAAQGVVAVITENHIASMFELNCETDFVAKAQPFKALVCFFG
jgi:translation elongation factor EF-Ts